MNENDTTKLKQFLFPDQVIGPGITELLHTASTAERVCRLKFKENEVSEDIYLQIHKDRILVACTNKLDSSPCELKELSEIKRMCLQLFNCEDRQEPYAHGIPALLMSKRKFKKLKEISSSASLLGLSEYLVAETGDDIHSAHLARVMKCFQAEGELRFCTPGVSGWKFQYASYIKDVCNGWLLRMSSDSSKDWVIALPMTQVQLCTSVTEWVLNYSPSFLNPL